jgi:hypothetical protein
MEGIFYPEELILKSKGGTFYYTITKEKDRNSGTIKSFTINIGTEHNKCVQIMIPPRESDTKDAYLIWVKSEERCSMERYIQKGFAQHILNLGITIARDINPSLETVSFLDDSSFKCTLPDNTTAKVSMRDFHIVFHESSWYEYYFGAFLEKNHEIYLKEKMNMYNPKYKPEDFLFLNDDLKDILTPIYESTETWHDFFQAIQTKFENKKCSVVYPWIRNALYMIFESGSYMGFKWIINIKQSEKDGKLQNIEFKSYSVVRKGGKYTRRKYKTKLRYSPGVFDVIPPSKLMALNYKRFLKSGLKSKETTS